MRFTNASLLALVDRLHAGPPESWPIIVIAADEGPFPDRYAEDEDHFQWLEAQPEELLGKFSILSAISVPGVDRAGLEDAGFSDDMTLVNLFRIVFNAAFDADLPMLPHRNWVFVGPAPPLRRGRRQRPHSDLTPCLCDDGGRMTEDPR